MTRCCCRRRKRPSLTIGDVVGPSQVEFLPVWSAARVAAVRDVHEDEAVLLWVVQSLKALQVAVGTSSPLAGGAPKHRVPRVADLARQVRGEEEQAQADGVPAPSADKSLITPLSAAATAAAPSPSLVTPPVVALPKAVFWDAPSLLRLWGVMGRL